MMEKYKMCLEKPFENINDSPSYTEKYQKIIKKMKEKQQCPTRDELLCVYLYTCSDSLAKAYHKACHISNRVTCEWRQFHKNLERFIEKYNETFHKNNTNIDKILNFNDLYHGTCAQFNCNNNNDTNNDTIKNIYTVFSCTNDLTVASQFGENIFHFTNIKQHLQNGNLKGFVCVTVFVCVFCIFCHSFEFFTHKKKTLNINAKPKKKANIRSKNKKKI